MRKDVRLGLAVGGILFGVVLVYVLFFAGGKGEDQYAIGDATSESTESTTGAGGTNSGSSSGGSGSARPQDTGTMLVETGPVSNTVTPQAPGGNTGNAGARNHAVVQGNVPAGNSPTTRPAGSPIASGFNAPAASAGASSFNWRQLMAEGDLSGQLLSRTVTPTPGGGREEHRIIMDPPLSSGGTNLEPRTGDLTAATGPRVYTVKSGDSFWSIAKTEYGNSSYYGHLVRANPKVDPAKLKAGMRITIPSATEVIPKNAPANALTPTPVAIDETRQYRVSKGDNLSSIAKKLYGRPDMADKIYELNRDVIGPNPSALKLNAILTLPETPARVAGAGGVN